LKSNSFGKPDLPWNLRGWHLKKKRDARHDSCMAGFEFDYEQLAMQQAVGASETASKPSLFDRSASLLVAHSIPTHSLLNNEEMSGWINLPIER
jgi:hypothetical protein